MTRDPALALDTALYDDDPVARDEARGWVAQHADEAQVERLVALLDARHRMTRRRTARILSEVRPERATPALLAALADPDRAARVRVGAARLLSVLADGEEPALAVALGDPDPRVRRAAVTPACPLDGLVAALADEDERVVERAAESLEAREAEVPLEAVRAARGAAPVLRRLLARVAPGDPALATAALEGDETALDHLADVAALRALAGIHPVVSAWGLARAGAIDALAEDPDPRVRAAAARFGGADLLEDPDPGVRWLARRAARGDYAPGRIEARLGPHARLDAPSAKPPYGLRPDDDVGEVPRVHAALALCHTRFDINLGVAVRSAEAAGLREVFLLGRDDLFRSPARGTDTLVELRHAPDPASLVRMAREGGYQIVGVQQTPASEPYHRADYPPRPLFVLGAEDTGLPLALRAAADLLVEIPMWGAIDSLNVAAAATTVVFHWRASTAGDP